MAKSRPARWAEATSKGQEALDELETAKAKLSEALLELSDLRDEYEEWNDNLPDFAQGSALADKLQEVVGLEFDPETDDIDSAREQIEAAEGADLPRGFGRD